VVRLYNVFAESQHALRIIGIYKNDFIIFWKTYNLLAILGGSL
jgi:hypothetical protein